MCIRDRIDTIESTPGNNTFYISANSKYGGYAEKRLLEIVPGKLIKYSSRYLYRVKNAKFGKVADDEFENKLLKNDILVNFE